MLAHWQIVINNYLQLAINDKSHVTETNFILFSEVFVCCLCLINPNWINTPTLYIGRVNFSLRYVRLCDLDIPREKWLNCLLCLLTVETLIRCCILLHLIWVCAVCQLPFWGLGGGGGVVSRLKCVNWEALPRSTHKILSLHIYSSLTGQHSLKCIGKKGTQVVTSKRNTDINVNVNLNVNLTFVRVWLWTWHYEHTGVNAICPTAAFSRQGHISSLSKTT